MVSHWLLITELWFQSDGICGVQNASGVGSSLSLFSFPQLSIIPSFLNTDVSQPAATALTK
jgi:hypothetical protein